MASLTRKIAKRFGITLLCLAAAKYSLHLLEPLVDTYLHQVPEHQRLIPPPAYVIPTYTVPKPPPDVIVIPQRERIEDILEEAVYVPR